MNRTCRLKMCLKISKSFVCYNTITIVSDQMSSILPGSINSEHLLNPIDCMGFYNPHQQISLDRSSLIIYDFQKGAKMIQMTSWSIKDFNVQVNIDQLPDGQSNCITQNQSERCFDSILNLKRGSSECLECQSQIYEPEQYKIGIQVPLSTHQHSQGTQKVKREQIEYQQDSHSRQDLQSVNQFTSVKPKKTKKITQTKKNTKNVTKNMGKLLFRFIWKNRKSLQKMMQIQSEEYQSFMAAVSLWKKQNNITRKFLLERWQGSSPNSILFRKISNYFFRKRCLGSIFQSHIEHKSMYVERFKKYQEAISDPDALLNLN